MIHWWNNFLLINWVAWFITDRLTVWMVDWLTGELLNLLINWLAHFFNGWQVDWWTDWHFVDVIAIFCYFSPNCQYNYKFIKPQIVIYVSQLLYIAEFVIILLFSTPCFCQWLSVLSIFRSIILVIPLHYRMYCTCKYSCKNLFLAL